MQSYGSNHRVGGGCRPTGLNRVSRPAINLEAMAAELDRRAKKLAIERAAWLLTDEGQAAIAREAAAVELQIQQEEAKRAEAAKREAWQKAWDTMNVKPPIGLILNPTKPYIVTVIGDNKKVGRLSCYALLQTVGEYPNKPQRVLANAGQRGMKLFLSSQSCDFLEHSNHDEFTDLQKQLEQERDYARRRAEQLRDMDYLIEDSYRDFDRHQPSFSIDIMLPVRIKGIAASGKSCYGEFILPAEKKGHAHANQGTDTSKQATAGATNSLPSS